MKYTKATSAADISGNQLPAETQPWVWQDVALRERVEDALAKEVGLAKMDRVFTC